MQIFTDPFITFITYCAPGLCAIVPYWMLWRVERDRGDHLMMLFCFILYFRGLQEVASLLMRFIFGSSFVFGDWGEPWANWTMALIGLATGLYMGIRYRRMGEAAKDIYPWDPFAYR
ncbi:hypothetical protein [Roseateles sp. L2-2]|uniref:hypothetical protein n=1 Tax=Roseateles sp. L2-2 TaxID=3422597 RepID=UPI003D35B786